jgi:tRNA(Ile)-lysidine synthase
MTFSAASLRVALDAHTPGGATGLVVALSGGADSASLLAAAAATAAAITGACVGGGEAVRGLPLRAVHVDHGLQHAAGSFRAACAAQCAALGVPLTVIPVVVNAPRGTSIEAAARDARYAALAEELRPGECLLTAHHSEDQAETVLLQALRGAGLKGMSAMPICRTLGSGWHLRPLLDVPQSELLAFGRNMRGPIAADPMNENMRFDRSYLRSRVWPEIAARWRGAGIALSRAAQHMAEAHVLLDDAAAADASRLRDGDALSVPGLRALSRERRINALRFWLREAGVEPPPTARLNEALRQVFAAQDDHLPVVAWGESALRRYRQRIFLTPSSPAVLVGTRLWACAPRASVDLGANLGALHWSTQNGGIDARRLPEELSVRRRDGGETLKPGPRARTQSLQHLCQSLGVLPWMRDALPLVYAGEALVAVGDLWLDARWCVPAALPGLGIEWRDAPIIV